MADPARPFKDVLSELLTKSESEKLLLEILKHFEWTLKDCLWKLGWLRLPPRFIDRNNEALSWKEKGALENLALDFHRDCFESQLEYLNGVAASGENLVPHLRMLCKRYLINRKRTVDLDMQNAYRKVRETILALEQEKQLEVQRAGSRLVLISLPDAPPGAVRLDQMPQEEEIQALQRELRGVNTWFEKLWVLQKKGKTGDEAAEKKKAKVAEAGEKKEKKRARAADDERRAVTVPKRLVRDGIDGLKRGGVAAFRFQSFVKAITLDVSYGRERGTLAELQPRGLDVARTSGSDGATEMDPENVFVQPELLQGATQEELENAVGKIKDPHAWFGPLMQRLREGFEAEGKLPTVRELADELGKRRSTVGDQLKKLRVHLRTELERPDLGASAKATKNRGSKSNKVTQARKEKP